VAGPVARAGVAEGEKGLLAMLQRLRSSEARLYAEYEGLVLAGDQVRAQFVFSEWSKLSEKLRAAEKGAPKTLEELGCYVRKTDVARELVDLHQAILKTLRASLRGGRLALMECASVREWNAMVDRIIEDAGRRLSECGFAEPLELTA